jgi:hypothetical protein
MTQRQGGVLQSSMDGGAAPVPLFYTSNQSDHVTVRGSPDEACGGTPA